MQNALADLRSKLALTQQDIADVLGVRRDVVAKIENGHRRLSLSEWLKLLEKLPLSTDAALDLAKRLANAADPDPHGDDDDARHLVAA